eukprot:jgi/Chlat1/2646/Chrsp178S02505
MPKSKRNKVVTLSHTKKKGRERKETLVSRVRECLDSYKSLYIIRFGNLRNIKLKELRDKLSASSRFFLGSNKVLQIALGRSPADEPQPSLHKASERVVGNRGLFFTNLPEEEVRTVFHNFEASEFARPGFIARETARSICLRTIRKLFCGNRGVVELVSDYTVCREGQPLSPEAAKLLRLFGIEMATSIIVPEARWSDGEFTLFPEAADLSDEKEHDVQAIEFP